MQTREPGQGDSRLAAPEAQWLRAALRAFAAEVVHDLSNPLNAASMNVELARMLLQRGDAARLSDCLERAVADCRRCADALQRVLAAARQGCAERSLGDLAALLRQAADTARRQCSLAAEAIVLPETATPSLPLDRPGIELALTLLFVDAFQAGAQRVHVEIETDAQSLRLNFCDDGPEIPHEALPELFEPFATPVGARIGHRRGSLLLNLARRILREHGGTLHAGKRPPGTCLLATLPQR